MADLAPTGVLRASINLGNPVLAQGTARRAERGDRRPGPGAGRTARRAGGAASASTRPGSRSRRSPPAGPTWASWPSSRPRAGGRLHRAVRRDRGRVRRAPGLAAGHGRGRRPRRRTDRGQARLGLRPVPHPHAAARRAWSAADEGVDVFLSRAAGGGGRHPAADDRLRRGASRHAADRGAVHGDPAGGGTTRSRRPETVAFLRDFVEELKAGGLRRGRPGAGRSGRRHRRAVLARVVRPDWTGPTEGPTEGNRSDPGLVSHDKEVHPCRSESPHRVRRRRPCQRSAGRSRPGRPDRRHHP